MLTEGQLVDVRRAAELTALAEQARAKAMREGTGGAGELSVLIRLESTAARAIKALGLKLDGKQPSKRTLADFLASHRAKATDAANEDAA